MLKEEFKKEVEQGILLDGLTKLINSNTENILTHTENMTKLIDTSTENMTKLINTSMENITSLVTLKKSEASSAPSSIDAGINGVSK